MARLTEHNMSPAERGAFQRLVQAVGFTPKVMFGRDKASNNHLLARVAADGDEERSVIYAIAMNGEPTRNNVREYRLLVTPILEGTKAAVHREDTRRVSHNIAKGVAKSWIGRRAKYGPAGRRWFRKPKAGKADVPATTPPTAA